MTRKTFARRTSRGQRNLRRSLSISLFAEFTMRELFDANLCCWLAHEAAMPTCASHGVLKIENHNLIQISSTSLASGGFRIETAKRDARHLSGRRLFGCSLLTGAEARRRCLTTTAYSPSGRTARWPTITRRCLRTGIAYEGGA